MTVKRYCARAKQVLGKLTSFIKKSDVLNLAVLFAIVMVGLSGGDEENLNQLFCSL